MRLLIIFTIRLLKNLCRHSYPSLSLYSHLILATAPFKSFSASVQFFLTDKHQTPKFNLFRRFHYSTIVLCCYSDNDRNDISPSIPTVDYFYPSFFVRRARLLNRIYRRVSNETVHQTLHRVGLRWSDFRKK